MAYHRHSHATSDRGPSGPRNHNLAAFAIAVATWLPRLCSSPAVAEVPFQAGPTVKLVAAQLERDHLSKKRLDDHLSRLWLERFLEELDPHRMYFTTADVQEFRKVENDLDDLARAGDFQFAEHVRDRYRARVSEAATIAAAIVKLSHDFSIKDECPLEFEGYARTPEELSERWRLRLKRELLIEKLYGRELPEVQSQLVGRYQRVARQARDMTDEQLCEIYLDSLAAIYDPHSAWMSPSVVTSFNVQIKILNYTLGLPLRYKRGCCVVVHGARVPHHSPANQVAGWNLIAVRGLDGKLTDLVEMPLGDVVDIIQQPDGPLGKDTELILELMHPVTFQRISMSCIRSER